MNKNTKLKGANMLCVVWWLAICVAFDGGSMAYFVSGVLFGDQDSARFSSTKYR